MISLGCDYAIRITTDQPLTNSTLDAVYRAVNEVLAKRCTVVSYDTAVDVAMIADESTAAVARGESDFPKLPEDQL